MRHVLTVAMLGLFSLCAVSCTDDNDSTEKKETLECDLSVYHSSKYDIIQKACNYIERCDQSIYTLYSNASYPKGLSDECHCNRYMNEILDNNTQDSVAYQAYSDLAKQITNDALAGDCSDNVTGILKAKVRLFFE